VQIIKQKNIKLTAKVDRLRVIINEQMSPMDLKVDETGQLI
jgi:hypothetical protein